MPFKGGTPPLLKSDPHWEKNKPKILLRLSSLRIYIHYVRIIDTYGAKFKQKRTYVGNKRKKRGAQPSANLPRNFFLRLKSSVECPLSENMFFLPKNFFWKKGGQ